MIGFINFFDPIIFTNSIHFIILKVIFIILVVNHLCQSRRSSVWRHRRIIHRGLHRGSRSALVTKQLGIIPTNTQRLPISVPIIHSEDLQKISRETKSLPPGRLSASNSALGYESNIRRMLTESASRKYLSTAIVSTLSYEVQTSSQLG